MINISESLNMLCIVIHVKNCINVRSLIACLQLSVVMGLKKNSKGSKKKSIKKY